MQRNTLRELLNKAKVTFKGSDKKNQLVEKALQSPEAMAIVTAEAREQGEHIDGVMFDVETVDGSFVGIDSSMLVQRTQPTGADQTSVRPSTLATNARISILTVNPLVFASDTTGNPSVRAFTNEVRDRSDTLQTRKRRSLPPTSILDSAVIVDPKRASRTGLPSPTRSSLSDSGLTAVDNAELANIQEVQQMAELMKGVMGELGLTFDSLGGQTAYLSSMAPIMETQHNIRKKVDRSFYASTY